MFLIRRILAGFILFFDWLFTPRGVRREAEQQREVDQKMQGLALYQYKACPFCVKVRREMKRQTLAVEIRDAKNDPQHKTALSTEGGKLKVPCLRIADDSGGAQWLYESDAIIDFLNQRASA